MSTISKNAVRKQRKNTATVTQCRILVKAGTANYRADCEKLGFTVRRSYAQVNKNYSDCNFDYALTINGRVEAGAIRALQGCVHTLMEACRRMRLCLSKFTSWAAQRAYNAVKSFDAAAEWLFQAMFESLRC